VCIRYASKYWYMKKTKVKTKKITLGCCYINIYKRDFKTKALLEMKGFTN
jgi:hypothetical protein